MEVCTQYWPTSVGTTMKYGELLVSNTSATNSDGVTKRIISISDPKVTKAHISVSVTVRNDDLYQMHKMVHFSPDH